MALDFDFTEEQEQFRQQVREFALKELAPRSAQWDEREEFPWDGLKMMANMGLMGLVFPKRLGGQEKGYVELAIAAEELGRGDITCAFLCSGKNCWGQPPVQWGDDVLREQIRGEKVFCIATTEPGGGSDSRTIRTEARRKGNDYIINGVKRYVSWATVAHCAGFTCRTVREDGQPGESFIKIELDSPGVTVTPIREFGVRAHQLANIVLRDVRVPVSNLLLEEHKGMAGVFDRWGLMRILNTFYPLGAAQQSLEETIEYVKHRQAFGRPIGKFEAVQFRIVEDYINIELARMIGYKGMWLADQGRLPNIREAAMTKAFGTVAACRAIDNCIQNCGSLGYSRELPLEQRYRDARAFQIANGTVDIMKIMLGRLLLGDECVPYR